ncbi:hypothetical protein TNCV_2814911 [Trichonephila clavipes]|nr:hypothetical protein TNCV_2814911 [Trichonephila clavipes]
MVAMIEKENKAIPIWLGARHNQPARTTTSSRNSVDAHCGSVFGFISTKFVKLPNPTPYAENGETNIFEFIGHQPPKNYMKMFGRISRSQRRTKLDDINYETC